MESTPKCSTATTSVAWRREAEAGTPPQAADSLASVVCVMEMEMEMEMAARQSSSLVTNSGRRTNAVQSVVTMVAVRSRAVWCRWMWVSPPLVRD
jgi:hypothetical protein